MVRLTRIYTKGGDRGETSLGDGSRRAKDDLRIEAYGTVDEANAVIGLARLHAEEHPDRMLARIQNDLFDLGADLCRPDDPSPDDGSLRMQEVQVRRLEDEIDAMNVALKPLDSFVLPGGRPIAAFLHQARTVVRRAERLAVALARVEPVNEAVIRYLNRLSDHLFVMARYTNDRGGKDVLWVPGKNREAPS